jgi:hypothetical protein
MARGLVGCDVGEDVEDDDVGDIAGQTIHMPPPGGVWVQFTTPRRAACPNSGASTDE